LAAALAPNLGVPWQGWPPADRPARFRPSAGAKGDMLEQCYKRNQIEEAIARISVSNYEKPPLELRTRIKLA
jgi:hypothetical protein